jgi:hypothetical protein
MHPHALLIDGLGTLVSLAPPVPALSHELAVRFGIEVSEEEAGRALGAEITFYRAHMGLGRDLDSLSALRRRCAEVMREALPPSERLAALSIEALTEALLSALRFDASSSSQTGIYPWLTSSSGSGWRRWWTASSPRPRSGRPSRRPPSSPTPWGWPA